MNHSRSCDAFVGLWEYDVIVPNIWVCRRVPGFKKELLDNILWQCLFFSQVSPGKIEAVDCRAPFDPDITGMLRPKLMFAIEVQGGQAVTMCYSDWEEEPHSGNLRVSSAFRLFKWR